MTKRILAVLFAFLLSVQPGSYTAQERTAASFTSDGVRIHYVDRGTGMPVVLLHGLTGSSARHFEAPGVIDALIAAGYRAIAMDARGHGESGKPQDESAYGMAMVADVVRLLDHLSLDRAHVVGYSMGGLVATQLLVKHPSRLRSATLVGAGWEGDDLSAIRAQMLALADGFARKDAAPLMRGVTGGQNSLSEQEIAAASEALFARNDALALAGATRGLISLFEISHTALRAIEVPVLAVIGEQDQSLAAARRMASVVPAMELTIIPGANHATSVRPSAAHIVAFLKKHSAH